MSAQRYAGSDVDTARYVCARGLVGIANVTAESTFDVRDLWAKKLHVSAQTAGFQVNVPSHDIAIYRLTRSNDVIQG